MTDTSEAKIARLEEQMNQMQRAHQKLADDHEEFAEDVHKALHGSEDRPGVISRLAKIENSLSFVKKVVAWTFTFVSGGGAATFATWLASFRSGGHPHQ